MSYYNVNIAQLTPATKGPGVRGLAGRNHNVSPDTNSVGGQQSVAMTSLEPISIIDDRFKNNKVAPKMDYAGG